MATDPKQKQSLTLVEFLGQSTAVLEDQSFDVDSFNARAALSEAITYPKIKDELSPQIIAEILDAPTKAEAAARFKQFLSDIHQEVTTIEGPAQFRAASENQLPRPDSPITEDVFGKLEETIIARRQRLAKNSAMRARELAHKFNEDAQKKILSGITQETETRIAETLEKPNYAATEPEAIETTARRIEMRVFPAQPKVKETVKEIIRQDKSFLFSWDPIVPIAVAEVLANPIHDPEIIQDTLSRSVKPFEAPSAEQIKEAVGVSVASVVVSSPKLDTTNMQLGEVTTGATAAIVNTLSKSSPGFSEVFIKQTFANAWERTVHAENFIQEMTDKFGKELVETAAFQQIIRQGYEPQKGGAQSIFSGIARTAAGVAEPLKAPPSEQMQNYIAALTRNGGKAPSPHEFIAILFLSRFPTAAVTTGSGTGSVLQVGAGAAELATKSATSRVVSGGISKLIGSLGLSSGPAAAIITPVLTFVSDVVLRKLFAFGEKMVGGLMYFVNGGLLEGKEIPLVSELFLIPFFIVVALVLFQGLQSPANTQNLPVIMRHLALATSLANAGGDMGPTVTGAPPGEPVTWSYSGVAPVSNITSSTMLGCPVHGGTITQGPNGQFSHKGVNAYDIASSEGAPIYATHDAYVVSFRDGIPPFTFINKSYGNYVLLVGQTPSGTHFFTMYAHLLAVNPIIQDAKNGTRAPACKNADPKLICEGEIIGYEDATGSTWGTKPGNGIHLHYELQGLDLLVLPPGCP